MAREHTEIINWENALGSISNTINTATKVTKPDIKKGKQKTPSIL